VPDDARKVIAELSVTVAISSLSLSAGRPRSLPHARIRRRRSEMGDRGSSRLVFPM
jgi:hypothetical protein